MYKHISFFLLLSCFVISCTEKEPIALKESEKVATVRFTDITTGMPIHHIKVIIANQNFNGFQIIDSVYTDLNGSIMFKKSGSKDFVQSYSTEYFQEDFQEVYKDSYEIKLYPKTAVRCHFKQVNVHKNTNAQYGERLILLPEIEAYQFSSTNTLSLVTIHSLYGVTEKKTSSKKSLYIQLPLNENQFIDTTITGYLHKNLYNSIKYSIAVDWGIDGYGILNSANSTMINPANSIPNEILIEF